MSTKLFTHNFPTPPTPPPISFAIPANLEYLGIREPKRGESWAFWDSKTNKFTIRHDFCKGEQMDCIHSYGALHPILKNETFVFNRKFLPKFGDIVLVKQKGEFKWEKRIFVKLDTRGKYVCFNGVDCIEELQRLSGCGWTEWDMCKSHTKKKIDAKRK